MTSSCENTIVIPHFKHKGILKCLDTLWRHTPHNFRVILVDQGDEDLTEKIKDKVHLYIKSYRQLGFAKACNIGWRLSDTEYTTLLNDDVEFIDKRWWQGAVDAFKNNIIAVNPKSPRQYAMGLDIENKYPYKNWTKEDYDKILKLPYKHTQCEAMFCTVFKTKEAKEVGYFDEFFYPAGAEDTDWIIRAKSLRSPENNYRGYEVESTPLSYVWHWWLQSNQDPTFMKSQIQLRQKWGWDMDMMTSTLDQIPPKIITKPL